MCPIEINGNEVSGSSLIPKWDSCHEAFGDFWAYHFLIQKIKNIAYG